MVTLAVKEGIRDIYYSGDPELRTWFLVRNDYMPVVLCLTYVAVVKWIGPALMKNRKPYELRLPMILYNSFLVAVYVKNVTRVIYLLFFLDPVKLCKPSRLNKADVDYELVSCAHTLYLLKYAEFLDTIFFILRKKDNLITNLHVLHHAILPWAAWTLLRTENSGFQAFPALINSIVHIIMYSYYGLAAMGPSVRKYLWWKRYLTMLQMTQFLVIIVIQIIVLPILGCYTKEVTFYLVCVLAVLFLIMFTNFYIKTFSPQKPAEKKIK